MNTSDVIFLPQSVFVLPSRGVMMSGAGIDTHPANSQFSASREWERGRGRKKERKDERKKEKKKRGLGMAAVRVRSEARREIVGS